MTIQLTSDLKASARRLFPDLSIEEALKKLLLERAQKNLIRYQVSARQFQTKYAVDFDIFREKVLKSEPSPEEEQDYFDWELAITGIEDMKKEIDQLK